MNKTECIKEFLYYGGNELFSSLLSSQPENGRAQAIDSLTELLKKYSDRLWHIKGRSAAYRYMIGEANRRGWLTKGGIDVNAYFLTPEESAYVTDKLEEYISHGGASRKALKKLIPVAAVAAVVAVVFILEWQKMSSEKYQKQMSEFYSSQVNIEYSGQTSEGFDFVISTTDNISEFIYMEHMPKLFYITSDSETEIHILPEYDISDITFTCGDDLEYAQDPRSVYSTDETVLSLSEKDYGKTFFPGRYRVEFDFYFYDPQGERVEIPTVAEEVTVR